jgi:membrane protease subunit HflK
MAWNEPGNGKDPWKRDGQGPTDLDKIVQNWQNRLSSLLGGGGGGASGGGGYFLVIFVLVAWGLTGFYRVDEAERGVVQRFGDFDETKDPTLPGLRWHLPYPIETVNKVNTIVVSEYAYRTEMLTEDMQYVFIDLVVQFRKSDPIKYSFKVVAPEQTLEDVTESALREVVGTNSLETLVSGSREKIASDTQAALQITLDEYEAGITVTSVSLKDVKYPQNVQAAVDDAQKARNDADRYGLEADAYANDILPKARGDAARMLEDAGAYHDRVIADAEGESARFVALLAEYEKAPRVTRDRLYIDAIEEVYRNSNKVILDSQGSGNLLYLPIDQLIKGGGMPVSPNDRTRSGDSQAPAPTDGRVDPNEDRERRTRQ